VIVGMEVEIITVGYEILEGEVLDTNSNWMAKRVAVTGNRLTRITVIEDDPGIIAEVLRSTLKREPSLVLISGGLGPTRDDLTLEGVSLALDRELEEHPGALEMVMARYRKIHADAPEEGLMTESRRKMAAIPRGSEPIPNPEGAAPGVMVTEGSTTVICLPGVPHELKGIFRDSVIPLLAKVESTRCRSMVIRGIGESALAPSLNRVMDETDVEIRSYPGKNGIRLKILGENVDGAMALLVDLLAEGVTFEEIVSAGDSELEE